MKSGDPAVYDSCNAGNYTEGGLNDYTNYEFSVKATDQVNNVGLPAYYTWFIGNVWLNYIQYACI